MDFPKEKMQFVTSHSGNSSPQGWLVLNIANMDLDGVNRIVISLEDVDRLRAAGDVQAEKLRKARELLGGE
jgi:hypothetical protein